MTRTQAVLAPTPGDGVAAPSGLRGAAPIIGLVVLAVLIAAAALVMHRGVSWRDEFPIDEALLVQPDTLSVIVGTCLQDPEVTSLTETGSDVLVSVVSTRWLGGPGGLDCQDQVVVTLREPLADRTLIDSTTGEHVTITR